MPDEPSITVANLWKTFQGKGPCGDVSFPVARGEFFGFLGPNGAGKTTTIKILCGLMKPDRGRASVAGVDVIADPLAAKARIGILPDTPDTFDRLTGHELV